MMNIMYNMNIIIVLFFITCLSTSLATAPSLFLTPLLKTHTTEALKNLSAVDPSLFLNVTSYSGYLTVEERYNSNMYFWYFPVENKPVNETPWVVWLQGGPGASSIIGAFNEVGPHEYDNEERKIKLRKWRWTKEYSMLFIDNPVGAGYSFTNSKDGFVRDMETCANHLYNTLRQFLMIFPELRKAPLYIAGESYAGRYIPDFALKILEQIESIGELDVNLQGIIMGNPVMSHESIADYSSVYEHWGVIDSQGVLAVKPLQDAYIEAISKRDASAAYDLQKKLLYKLIHISYVSDINVLDGGDPEFQLRSFLSHIEKSSVRDAMHIGFIDFTYSNHSVHEMLKMDFLTDHSYKLMKLLETHRILIYCGQLDVVASCTQNAQARRRSWQWSGRDNFLQAPRSPWWYNYEVAGYVKSGGNLTEIQVRGAGHLVGMDKPGELYYAISQFTRGKNVDTGPYYASPEYTPVYVTGNSVNEIIEITTINAAMVVSLCINVVLVIMTTSSVIYALRWKRKAEEISYRIVDTDSIQ